MIFHDARTFEIILADCPWHYRGRKQFGFAGDVGVDTGGAVCQYNTMTVEELCALPVPLIAAKNSLLFHWVTSPCLEDGVRVMHAWGFEYATVAFAWDKQRTNPGYYTLSQVELCLVGKRGSIPQPRGSRNERQFISSLRGRHSAKPVEVQRRIERMFPAQRKLELFAREQRPGWTVWGNQITP